MFVSRSTIFFLLPLCVASFYGMGNNAISNNGTTIFSLPNGYIKYNLNLKDDEIQIKDSNNHENIRTITKNALANLLPRLFEKQSNEASSAKELTIIFRSKREAIDTLLDIANTNHSNDNEDKHNYSSHIHAALLKEIFLAIESKPDDSGPKMPTRKTWLTFTNSLLIIILCVQVQPKLYALLYPKK